MKKATDKNVEKAVDLLRSRAELGLKKYGCTTERKDLTPLEWIRHFQGETADATIYAERLAQDVTELAASHERLLAAYTAQKEELEVLRKAMDGARDSVLAAFQAINSGAAVDGHLVAIAESLGVDIRLAPPAKKAPAKRPPSAVRPPPSALSVPSVPSVLRPPSSVLSPPSSAPSAPPSTPPDSDEWLDARQTPPAVRHAVLARVNGTTRVCAAYYIDGFRWVDVSDNPIKVTQWRHL